MRYWIPELVLGVLHPNPPIHQADKFGGLPWGLPQNKWPGDGEGPYVFFAQFTHHLERANLGREGRVAFLFLGGTDTDETVVFVDSEELSAGPTCLPRPKSTTLTEAWVTEWEDDDDGLSDSILPYFMSEKAYYADEFSQRRETVSLSDTLPGGTRLGSVPDWVQSPYDAPPVPPFVFIGQFSGDFDFDGPAPSAEQTGCPIEQEGSSIWSMFFPRVMKPHRRSSHPGAPRKIRVHKDGTYFCDDNCIGDGLAYLFVNPDPVTPVGKFFIQVT
ncbi:MAG: hypothetical protein V4671_27445 [Armatimonadota bacterium]